ncbi:hypothetical protein HIM_02176 [Hirsutella minnesotensis 3608]|nr:hypothetical protein HIM_02176 [Hirsutella minnesotensis 3608]
MSAERKPKLTNRLCLEFAVNGTGIPLIDFDIGESYAGMLPISEKEDEKNRLFYWFFPTPNKEHQDKKEIVIWLNGGPGFSSLVGLSQENGPWLWPPGTAEPQQNPWSWHRLSNIVYIEQPVRTGYSTGDASIKSNNDIARQFLGFWKNFVKTFSMENWKVYIATESYGGYYGPYISSHMINANDTRYYDLAGLMIYDGIMFNDVVQFRVILESFLEQNHGLIPLDENTMKRIHDISSRCGFTDWNKKYFTYPPAGPAPNAPPGGKLLENGTFVAEGDCGSIRNIVKKAILEINPCFDEYNIAAVCPRATDPIRTEDSYFNRTDVKKALNVPLSIPWEYERKGVVFNTTKSDTSEPPDKYELPQVVEKTKNVILAHGSLDYCLPADGVLVGLQNMTWSGQRGFQTAPSDPFYVPAYGFNSSADKHYYGHNLPTASGVLGTTHHERGLTFVITQLAGHEGPAYSAAGAFRHLEKLLGRVKSLSDTTPFTLPELRGIVQRQKPLGNGTVKIPCFGRGC